MIAQAATSSGHVVADLHSPISQTGAPSDAAVRVSTLAAHSQEDPGDGHPAPRNYYICYKALQVSGQGDFTRITKSPTCASLPALIFNRLRFHDLPAPHAARR